MQYHALPTLTPALHRIQGRIIIKPMTCPQVRSSKVRNDVVVRDARQFLLERDVCGFEGRPMCRRWSLAAEDVCSSHGPSSGGGGSEVDLVCLEAAGAAVDDYSEAGV